MLGGFPVLFLVPCSWFSVHTMEQAHVTYAFLILSDLPSKDKNYLGTGLFPI